MLVLSRRCGEKIIIGDREVEIIVISYDKGQVKLGFEADKRIKINREEVYVKVEDERKPAELQKQLEKEAADDLVAANDDEEGDR